MNNPMLLPRLMKYAFCSLSLLLLSQSFSLGQSKDKMTETDQKVIALSKDKWRWMSEKKIDSLTALFHDQSMFVHMGGTWGKKRELEVIQSGQIWYKQAETYSTSINIIGNTAIVLNDIDLLAVVGTNEVINPFMVTEVYILEEGQWKMGSLTFSRLLRPVKMKK